VSYVAQAWAGSKSWAARLDGYNGSAQACTVLGREEKEKRGRKPHVFVASMYVCMYVCMYVYVYAYLLGSCTAVSVNLI